MIGIEGNIRCIKYNSRRNATRTPDYATPQHGRADVNHFGFSSASFPEPCDPTRPRLRPQAHAWGEFGLSCVGSARFQADSVCEDTQTHDAPDYMSRGDYSVYRSVGIF